MEADGLYVYECFVYVDVCVPQEYLSACRTQPRDSGLLELELETAASRLSRVGRTERRFSARGVFALNL